MASLLGLLLFLGALIAAGIIIWGYVQRQRTASPAARPGVTFTRAAEVARLDPNRQRVDVIAKFQALQPGQTIITLTDDYFLVRGVVNLTELNYGDADGWRPTGREFVLAQTDDEMGRAMTFAWLPSAEGGDLRLYRLSQQNAAGWTQFLAGTDDAPGPARNFADLDQRLDLTGDDLTSIRFKRLATHWEMTDIGQARYRGSGNAFMQGQGEVRYALAQAVDSAERLLFVDFLEGGSGSSDGLFVGDEFDPTLIKDVQAYVGGSRLQNA